MQLLAQSAAPAERPPVRGPMIDLSQLSEHWGNKSGTFPVHWALLAIGAVIAGFALIGLVRWWRRGDGQSRPLLVFNAVAKQVGLSWAHRLLLIRIARAQRLPGPLTLLVCPATLDHHVRAFAEARPGRADAVLATAAAIHRRAFGGGPRPG